MAFGRKSKLEIHRDDMKARDERYREETEARDLKFRREAEERDARRDKEAKEHRERMERFSEEAREERAASEGRWLQLSEKFDHEFEETRRFNAQMLTRLDKTYFNLGTSLNLVAEKLELMGRQIEANTEEVKAQTDAIFQLLDHFKGSNGGPPV